MGAYPLLKAVTGLAYYGVAVQKSVSAAQGQSFDQIVSWAKAVEKIADPIRTRLRASWRPAEALSERTLNGCSREPRFNGQNMAEMRVSKPSQTVIAWARRRASAYATASQIPIWYYLGRRLSQRSPFVAMCMAQLYHTHQK